MVTPI